VSLDLPRFPVLQAPPTWQAVDFISDLHLQATEPLTLAAWHQYMASTPADAIFILGDLFEVWVGDDTALLPGFEQDCARTLAMTSHRCAVFFMPGNRDFLLGARFLETCGIRLLPDPVVLDFAGQRWLLSHGDALCLDDIDYQLFRTEVRSAAWQQAFLARPVLERQAIARELRRQSEARRQSKQPESSADVDAATACEWLDAAQASILIHGHTHRPATHALGSGTYFRQVLSDWDVRVVPPRLQVLRGSANGLQRITLAGC
jgi:UDP-2,3-diacylglucosamine hydrolase